jgi:hypothetical protein
MKSSRERFEENRRKRQNMSYFRRQKKRRDKRGLIIQSFPENFFKFHMRGNHATQLPKQKKLSKADKVRRHFIQLVYAMCRPVVVSPNPYRSVYFGRMVFAYLNKRFRRMANEPQVTA